MFRVKMSGTKQRITACGSCPTFVQLQHKQFHTVGPTVVVCNSVTCHTDLRSGKVSSTPLLRSRYRREA
jgi:hypothetical protein